MNQKGQIIVISLIFMTVMLLLGGGLLGYVGQNVIATRSAYAKEQAILLSDAGIDQAVRQLNATAGAYTGELGTVLATGVFDVSVAALSGSVKEVTVTGYAPNKVSPLATRTVKAEVSIDTTTVSFNYGVQIGDGGLEMSQGAKVTGNVYSNGPITGSLLTTITGDAFSAGALGRIQSMIIGGTAYAHTITFGAVGGNAKGYSLASTVVGGSVFEYSISTCVVGGNASYTTKFACVIGGSQITPYAGEPDPAAQAFPIPDQQITDWKNDAAAGGTIIGNYTLGNGQPASLGPKKITGDLIMDKNSILTLTGPVWVVGKIDIDKDATVKLDVSYGSDSEVFMADGIIDLSKEVNFQRAGAGSYILALTASSSGDAMKVAKSADALIVYAPNGTVTVQKSSHLREVTAWKLKLEKDTEVTYDAGLADVNFSSGPGASWAVSRGTWREIK